MSMRRKESKGILDYTYRDTLGRVWKVRQVDVEVGLTTLKKIMKHKIGR